MKNLLFLLVPMLFLTCNGHKKQDASTDNIDQSIHSNGPNIIFILADDLGYGDLGCYGQNQIRTPNIDKMASEGMQFTQFYAGSTVCAPSRCSLMTGMHTGHTVVRGNKEMKPMGQFPLPENTTTIAELLQKTGYTTGLIGKWGLGGPGSTGTPNKQGFDYFFGYLGQRHAHNYYPEFLFRNDQRVPLKNKLPEPKREDGAGVSIKKVEYSADLLNDEAIKFIKKNRNKQFFLYYAATLPHANNEGGDQGMEVPDYGIYKNEHWPDNEKGFASMVTRLDTSVGAILKTLKKEGLDKNTLVIFTSDNGPHEEGGHHADFFNSNGPLRGTKRDLYEGGIRVPMIAYWPGIIKADTTSNFIGAFWDVMPTLCEVSGAPEPDLTDGISFLPTLLGKPQIHQHDYLYWEFHEQGEKQAVRLGPWKGIRLNIETDPESPIELYNLNDDLGETHNVAKEHPEIADQIDKIMKYGRIDDPNWPFYPSNQNNPQATPM